MALNSPSHGIIIDGNTFDYGVFSSTTYSYIQCIATTADCNINNNYVSGIATNGKFINVVSSSCNIENNKFIRGSTNITSYIDASSSAFDQFIVNNIFDSPTVDGSNENLVNGLSPNSTYHSNKNQTGYRALYKSDFVTTFDHTPFTLDNQELANYTVFGTAGEAMNLNYTVPFAQPTGSPQFSVTYGSSFVVCAAFTVPGTFSDIDGLLVQFSDNGDFYRVINPTGSGSTVTGFQLQAGSISPTPAGPIFYSGCTTGGASAKFFRTGGSPSLSVVNTPATPTGVVEAAVNINDLLPLNVQILSLVVGVYVYFGSGSITGGEVLLSSTVSQSAQYSLSALSGTIADVRTSSDSAGFPGQILNSFIIGFGGGQVTPTQLANATHYVQLDTSALANYVTEKNKIISVIYALIINVTTTGPVTVVDSPLVIRYRW